MNPALLRLAPVALRWIGGTLVAYFASDAISDYADSSTAESATLPTPPQPPTHIGGPDWDAYLVAMQQYRAALEARTGTVASTSAKYGVLAGVAAVGVLGYLLAKRR